jgi:signal recognition particle GTPase
MICNVDGTFKLEPSDIRTYNLVVAKLLQEKAVSNDKTMSVDKFVRYMYKEMITGLEDEQKALAFARHTPDAILLAGMADPTTREGLKAKGYKTEDVENLQTMLRLAYKQLAILLLLKLIIRHNK